MKRILIFAMLIISVLLYAQTEVKISELDKETNIGDNDIFVITFDSSSTWVSRGFIWSALVAEMEEDIRLDETQVSIDTIATLWITTALNVDGITTTNDTVKMDDPLWFTDNTGEKVFMDNEKYILFTSVDSEAIGNGLRFKVEDLRVIRNNSDAQRPFHVVLDSTNNVVDVTIENDLWIANASNDSALIRMDLTTENLLIGSEPGKLITIMDRDSTAGIVELTGNFSIMSGTGDGDTVLTFTPNDSYQQMSIDGEIHELIMDKKNGADSEGPEIKLETDDTGTHGPVIQAIKNSASPAANDTVFRMISYFYNDNGTPEKIKGSEETILITDGTDGSEDARTLKTIMLNGAETELWEFDPAKRSFKMGQYTGIVDTITAGENVSQWDALYLKSDGKYWKSDADASSTMPVVAIAMEAINADATGDGLLFGYVYDATWNWTPGALIYASTTSGDLTATAPSATGDQVQIVGYAKDADSIQFMPNLMLLEIE